MPSPAAFAWLIAVGTVLGFESWAFLTHHQTMSEWIRLWNHKLPFITPLGVGSLIYLIYHLFFTE